MEREVKKLKTSPANSRMLPRSRQITVETDASEAGKKLEQYLEVAKGEINRLGLHRHAISRGAIRPGSGAVENGVAQRHCEKNPGTTAAGN